MMFDLPRFDMDELVERARRVKMTPEQEEAQRQSFAYGNCHIDNPRVTRSMVEEAARNLGVEPIHAEEDKPRFSLSMLMLIAAVVLFFAPIINWLIFKAMQ
jgi:hypothetical protein